jgi:group I intron endonuclease
MIIYLARCRVNGKGYVRKTITTLAYRWRGHVASVGQGCQTVFARAIRKYGSEAFDLSVLQECQKADELDAAERYWIRELNTYENGYNSTLGGDGKLGCPHGDEARAKMRAAWTAERRQRVKFRKIGRSGRAIARCDSTGRVLETYETIRTAAKAVNGNETLIVRVARGKAHAHKGFV